MSKFRTDITLRKGSKLFKIFNKKPKWLPKGKTLGGLGILFGDLGCKVAQGDEGKGEGREAKGEDLPAAGGGPPGHQDGKPFRGHAL